MILCLGKGQFSKNKQEHNDSNVNNWRPNVNTSNRPILCWFTDLYRCPILKKMDSAKKKYYSTMLIFPHISSIKWHYELLPHPTYSRDPNTWDFLLFQNWKNDLVQKMLNKWLQKKVRRSWLILQTQYMIHNSFIFLFSLWEI